MHGAFAFIVSNMMIIIEHISAVWSLIASSASMIHAHSYDQTVYQHH